MNKKKTFCNICSAFCGFEAEVENNQILSFRPDKSHPMSKGFSCSKGRNFPQLLNSPNRISHCKERINGELQTIDKLQALDKISDRLRTILDTHGPESVAVYCGNGVTFKALGLPSVHAFMDALGSHHIYTSLTIDQPAKIIGAARHGIWMAGGHSFDSAQVLMLFGNNPLVSGLNGPGSIPSWDPGALKAAKKRGLKLIVVDPRHTETAQQADLHLAIKPGTDAILLAGMIHYILENELADADFCAQFTEGMAELAEQVESYDLTRVARLTDLDESLIREATELFVKQARGIVSSGTGPDMAPHPNLTEHLIYSMNTLCGRHNRVGDKVATSLLTPNFPPMATPVPFDFLPDAINLDKNTQRSRVRGAHQVYKEMPTSTLAEEILTPGEGQLKALLVIGGNPLLSIPEQDLTRKALEALDLCVVIDGRLSDTAQYADFFLPATYGLEKFDMTAFNDIFWGKPFHQITEAVVEAPGDASDEYLYLFEIAKRLALQAVISGQMIDLENPPRDLDLLEMIFPEAMTKVPVRDIAAHANGHIYEEFDKVEVLPAMEGMEDKLQFMPSGISEEFASLAESIKTNQQDDTAYRLICRRNPHVYNSMCHEFPMAPEENPAWLNPQDMLTLGLQAGDEIILETANAKLHAIARSDDTLRTGVVSVSHGFTDSRGIEVSRLLEVTRTTDPIAKIPLMSAVPIRVQAAKA